MAHQEGRLAAGARHPGGGAGQPGDRPLGRRGLAPGRKKARDDGAHVVLIDESGFFLNPLVRRTWAPKGHTPVLTGSGHHRQEVSTIAAISVAPGRRRVGLYWKTDPKDSIDAPAVVESLRGLLRHLKGKVIVIWDGGSNHKGPAIRALLERYPPADAGTVARICPGPQPGRDALGVPEARTYGQLRAGRRDRPGKDRADALGVGPGRSEADPVPLERLRSSLPRPGIRAVFL